MQIILSLSIALSASARRLAETGRLATTQCCILSKKQAINACFILSEKYKKINI
jgi:hypothetical protein